MGGELADAQTTQLYLDGRSILLICFCTPAIGFPCSHEPDISFNCIVVCRFVFSHITLRNESVPVHSCVYSASSCHGFDHLSLVLYVYRLICTPLQACSLDILPLKVDSPNYFFRKHTVCSILSLVVSRDEDI